MLRKPIQYLALIGMLSCLVAASPALADAGDDDSGLEDNMTFHVYDDVDLVSTLKFNYGKPRIIIKSVYPQLASETDHEGINNFNDLAEQIVEDEISGFRNQVKENASIQQKMPKNKISNNLYIDYDTSYIRSKHNHIISIRFSFQGYVGGTAHPYHHQLALNYNLDTSQKIELSDLFLPESNYLEILSGYTSNVLSRRLQNRQMISDCTAARPENFANWNIKPNGLLITFDESKVAPYVYGAQTVLVPYTALQQVISPDSPIADCISHQRRCSNSNLLTGGFIDEAVNTLHGTLDPVLGQG